MAHTPYSPDLGVGHPAIIRDEQKAFNPMLGKQILNFQEFRSFQPLSRFGLSKFARSRVTGTLDRSRICAVKCYSQDGTLKDSDQIGEYLNKLPLPDLRHTIKKYLMYAKPFLSQQDFTTTKKVASSPFLQHSRPNRRS